MNPIDKDMQTKWVGLKAEISDNEYPTDQTPQGKKRDNDFVDMHAKYVLPGFPGQGFTVKNRGRASGSNGRRFEVTGAAPI